jgi:RHS repeat-associated protein
VGATYAANFAQNITYTPWGALSSLTNGCAGSGCTNTMETYTYNKRLQTSQIQLGTTGNPAAYYTLGYNYSLPGGTQPPGCPINPSGTSGNNGNVIGYTYTDTLDSTLSHSAFFVYDTLNRLACAQATGNSTYNLTYGYSQDGSGQLGNMTCVYNSYTNGPCPASPLTFSAANNRITSSGYSYDAAGNMLSDGTYGYTWDGEERLTSTTGSGVSDSSTYNALGQMAQFNMPSAISSFVYDPAGQLTGQYNATRGYWWGQFIRVNGRIIAFNTQGTNNTVFLHKDLADSTHMVSGPSGSVFQDQIFYPWGQSWHYLGTWYQQEFGGMFLFDPANSLYTSLTRTYNPTPGRWLSPDPLGQDAADPSDPQTWNMYAYVRNNPTTNTDPTGETYHVCQTDPNGNQSNCTDISDEQFAQFQQENKDTLTFTGSGNVLQNGTVIGSFQQTSVDLPSDVARALYWAGITANANIKTGATIMAQNAALAGIGQLVGMGIDALLAARAASAESAAIATADIGNLSSKIVRQMGKRAWTVQDILDTIQQAREAGSTFSVTNKETGGTATEFVSPSSGRFVVVDDTTRQVLQISGPGFRPNYQAP